MSYGQPRMQNGYAQHPGYPNGNYSNPPAPPPLRPSQTPQVQHMSRAEAFDDEKKRIVASCFAKKDDKGVLLQSYITHIRVEEDGAYPSDPPPAHADPQHKKQRVIIAAVKMSGRVYLHKARENDDRTFQIGKTWPLEELQTIESFASGIQRSPRDQERARLAGDVGFVITIAKPYFWKAKTPKEKQFFIGSVVKIYRKYTNGKIPQLVGFESREERDIVAASEPTPRPPAPPSPGRSPAPGLGAAPGPPPPMPYAQRAPSSNTSLPSQDGPHNRRPHRPSDVSTGSRSPSAASSSRRPPSSDRHHDEIPPLQPGAYGAPSQGSAIPGRSTTPKLRSQASQESHLRSRPSQEQQRPQRMETPPMAPPKLNQQSSRSNFASSAPSEDRNDHRMPSSRFGSETPDMARDPPKSPSSFLASPHDSYSVSSATTDRWRPPGVPSRAQSGTPSDRHHAPNESIASAYSGPSHPSFMSDRSTSSLQNQSLPERRRPPLENNSFSSHKPTQEPIDEEHVPKPLRTPKPKQEPPRPQPEESLSQLDARMPGGFTSPSPSRSRTPPPPLQTDLSSPKKQSVANDLTNGPARKSEDSKPAPLSTRKSEEKPAALPRKSEDSKSLTQTTSTTDMRPSTPESTETPRSAATSPEKQKPGLGPMMGKKLGERNNAMANWGKVKKAATAATAAKAFTPRAGGAAARLRAQKTENPNEPDGVTSVVPAPSARVERAVPDEMKQDEAPDVQITSASPSRDQALVDGHDRFPLDGADSPTLVQKPQPQLNYQYDKALEALGIEVSMLGGQGQEYEATLTEFGWGQSILQGKTIETLESDMRREIGRLEAGPWLSHDTDGGEQQDQGVTAFEKVLDKTISECDEMERLLSLYSVELSVSLICSAFQTVVLTH